MSRLVGTAMFITRMAIALTIVGFAFGAAGATPAQSKKQDCTWGASSATAWVDADGTIHQSKPAITGCTP